MDNVILELNEMPKERYKSIIYLGNRQYLPSLKDRLYEGSNVKIIDEIEINKFKIEKNYPAMLVWDKGYGERKYARIDIV